MKQPKISSAILLAVLIVMMFCISGCTVQDSQTPGSDENAAGSSTPNKEEAEESGEYQPTEDDNLPAQTRTLDFSLLNGMGNNLSNLLDSNSSFTFTGAFASDGTYIYFSSIFGPRTLYRMKLNGSECEEYIEELGGRIRNFNLADGELYYCIDSTIYAVNLNTKEVRTVVSSFGTVRQMLLVGDRIYWTHDDNVLMTTTRDGSNRAYYCYRGNKSKSPHALCELATDGEKLYFLFVDEVALAYELDLNVSCEEAEEAMISTGTVGGLPNGNFYTVGTNGILYSRENTAENKWEYVAKFYDELDNGSGTVVGTFGEKKDDDSFYWPEMGFPKFVLGSNLFGVYNSKYEEGISNTVSAPHYIYMMPDMDTSDPILVHTYSGEDFCAGGVYGDKLYLIERIDDVYQLTTLDQNGNVVK